MGNEIDPFTGLTGDKKRMSERVLGAKASDFEVGEGGMYTGLEANIYAGNIIGERSRFDENITVKDLENLELERALHQPLSSKIFNATVGGISSGVMTAVEVLGYITDVENNIKRIKGLDFVESNEISNWAKGVKEDIDKSTPIHRYDSSKAFDWSDPGFYMQMFKGVLDSAVGFAIPGMAMTKAVGAIQGLVRATKYLNFLKASKFGQSLVNSGVSAFFTNYGEGKLMALEQFDNSMKDMQDRLFQYNMEKIITEVGEDSNIPFRDIEREARRRTEEELTKGEKFDEFRGLAGEEANRFININKAFMFTDMIGLQGIYRGANATRAALQKNGLKAAAKRFGTMSADNMFVQSFKEGAEEIGQNVAQMEAEYRTLKGAGFDTGDTPEGTHDRMLYFATSDQALLEGMMGLFGGGPQRIFTEAVSGKFGAESKRQYRDRYEQQQEQIKRSQEFLNTRLGYLAEAESLRAEGISKGMDNLGEVIKKKQFFNILGSSFEMGTTKVLEEQLQEIVNATPEQRKENGWGEDSAEEAKEHLKMIRPYEKMFNRYSKYNNQTEVFMNRVTRQLLLEDKKKVQDEIDNLKEESDNEEIADPEKKKLLASYQRMLSDTNRRIKMQDQKFNDITKGDYQQAYQDQQDDFAKRIREFESTENTKARRDAANKKASERNDTADIKEDVSEGKHEEEFTGDEDITEQEKRAAEQGEEQEFAPDPHVEEESPLPDDQLDDELDVSIFSTADEDFYPDDMAAPDDIEASSMPQDQIKKSKQRKDSLDGFKKASRDLFQDFEDDVSGFPSKMSNAQYRVGKMEEMLEHLRTLKQNTDVTFSDLIMALVTDLGSKRVRPMFGMLESLYYLQHSNYQVTGKSLDEYLELSRKEKLSLEVRKNKRRRATRPQYTPDIDKELEEYTELLASWVNESNSDPNKDETITFTTNSKKVKAGAGILAYLSRVYEIAFGKNSVFSREEISDEINKDMISMAPLDPARLLPGTKLTMRVDDDDNADVYTHEGAGAAKTKWGIKKQGWKDDPTVDEKTYNRLFIENVPILVYDGEEQVAHLHETGWIKPQSVYGNLEKDRKHSRNIRAHIVENEEYTTTVKSKSIGYLFRTKDNSLVQTSKALPDQNLPIYIGSDGEYRNSRTRKANNNLVSRLLNKGLPIQGVAYIILPLSKNKQIAIPMRNMRLRENSNVMNTIMTAIKIFYEERSDPASLAIINSIKESTKTRTTRGMDITTANGIYDFMKLFVYNKNIAGEKSLKNYLSRPDTDESDNHTFIRMSRRVRDGSNDMHLEVGRGKRKRYVNIFKRSLNSARTTPRVRQSLYKKLETMMGDMYASTNLDHLGQNNQIPIIDKNNNVMSMPYQHYIKSMSRVPFLSHNIAPKGQPFKWVYTVQPVIDLDFSKIDGSRKKRASKKKTPDEGLPSPQAADQDSPVGKAQTEEKAPPPNERPKRRRGLRLSDPDKNTNQDDVMGYPRPMTQDEMDKFDEKSKVWIHPATRDVTGVIIGELTLGRQESIINYLKSEVVRTVIETQEKVDKDEIFDVIEEDFRINMIEIADEIRSGNTDPDLAVEKDMYALYLKNWNEIKAITVDEISRASGIKIKTKKPQSEEVTDEELSQQIIEGQSTSEESMIELDSDEFLTEEEEESFNMKEGWTNAIHFTIDPADGIAAEIKQFLLGIEELVEDESGEFITVEDPYLGTEKIVEYQELYELLQRITPSLRPNFKDIINELEKYVKAYPTLRTVIDKISGADESLQNKFTDAMTNYYIDMRFIMVSKDENGQYELIEHESDINEHSRIIRHKWFANLKVNGDVAVAAAENQSIYVLNPITKENLATQFNDITARGEYTREEIDTYLRTVGIELSGGALDELMEGTFRHNGHQFKIDKQFIWGNGLFKIIHENIALSTDAVPVHHERLFNESVINSLSKLEAEYDIYHHSASHRTGRKTVFSYSPTKFAINRLRELVGKGAFTDGVNPLVEKLFSSVLGPSSEWLRQIRENGGENAMVQNLDHWTVSLEPVKRKGSKPRNNNELHRISDTEIEVYKAAMLQNQFQDRSGGGNRIIKMLYPTTSDKTHAFGLRVLAEILKLEEDGNISVESINTLVERIILPEIHRIQEFQKQKGLDSEEERHTIDNNEFQKGSEQFLFFPQLNNVEGIFIGGDLNPDIEGDEMMALITEKVGGFMNALVDEKLREWNSMGIADGTNLILNHKFINGEILETGNPLRGLKNRGAKIRGAATDMVFQYLIGNAEIAKVFIGDPAAYFRTAPVNIDENGNRKPRFLVEGVNPEYDFIADAEETYINMGKRLAADIAPGSEIPMENGQENFYMQGFIMDNPEISKNVLQITKLLDGQAAYDKVKPVYEKFKDKETNSEALYKVITGLRSAPYFAIDSADAQEYTTWKEHLWLMKQLGELNSKEYADAYITLDKGDDLNTRILRKVMQPMKPVFVDNIMDEVSGFERRVYIKSSAFPLLPQLTRGIDLDNLRQAMEGDPNSDEDAISRVAFGTAVKVGNVSQPLNIFDENGRIKPVDQLIFDNSALRLNRKGFRIQQKIPHAAHKKEINKVSQATKNLLVNMLGVEGFKTDWIEGLTGKKSLTGAELQQVYHDIFGELHQIEKNALYESIMRDGTEEGVIDIDDSKLRDVLIREAKERNYPISDQELIAITDDLSSLGFSPSANKYEALLNSIVTNRIIKMKFPGKSYVLGSESGFREKRLTPEEVAKKVSNNPGIVFIDEHWNPEKGLLPAREGENGERLPAQALIPWKYKNQKGKLISLKQFTKKTADGRIVLDMDKIEDKDVLEIFGMRIPNQGPNSQSWIEIVGFLPESSGDLLIASQDYVIQMGSDFDVDKLYAYMYNTYVDSTGKLRKHVIHDEIKTVDERKRALQNRIIDIHIAIHKNPDSRVQSQIAAPLVPWKLRSIATDVVNLRRTRETVTSSDSKFAHQVTPTKIMRMDFDDQFSKLLDGSKTQTTREKLQDYQEGEYVTIESKDGGRAIAQITYIEPVDINEVHKLDEENEYFNLEGRSGDKDSFVRNTHYLTNEEKVDNVVKIGFKVLPIQKIFTGLSDSYQRNKFKNATAGKVGVSAFSLDSMFNAVAQGKDLIFSPVEEGERIRIRVVFGRKVSNGNLSREFALDEETFISDIIAGYQSASADNEKEQILDKLNINRHTMSVAKIMNQFGFTKEVPYFLAQDIIVDFARELDRTSGIFAPYSKDRHEDARKNVLKLSKYNVPTGSQVNVTRTSELAGEKATVENLRTYISDGPRATNYAAAQRALLDKFIELSDYGTSLQRIQSAINIDSAGVGKSLIESQLKEDQIYALGTSSIKNAEYLIGDIRNLEYQSKTKKWFIDRGYVIRRVDNSVYAVKPNTINGHAIVKGLFTNNDLWQPYFRYNDTAVQSAIAKIEDMTTDNKDSTVSVRAEQRYEIWKHLKSFAFSDDELKLHTTTAVEERERLVLDKYDLQTPIDEHGFELEGEPELTPIEEEESLARFVHRFKQSSYYRSNPNPMIEALDVDINTNGDPSKIIFMGSTSDRKDQRQLYAAFTDMFRRGGPDSITIGTFQTQPYTLREFAQDLVTYTYLTGGIQEAIQFVKFIPASYLAAIPFLNYLSNKYNLTYFNHNKADELSVEMYNIPNYGEQYVQHTPEKVPTIESKGLTNVTIGKNIKKFKLNEKGRKRYNKRDLGGESLSPPYLSMFTSDKDRGDYRIFKFSREDSEYTEIDTLGFFGVSEYNKNTVEYQSSIFERNKSNVDRDEIPNNDGLEINGEDYFANDEVNDEEESPVLKDLLLNKNGPRTPVDTTVKQINDNTQKDETFSNGVEKAGKINEEIASTSLNAYNLLLASELAPYITMLHPDMRVSISHDPKFKYPGHYRMLSNGRYEHVLALDPLLIDQQNEDKSESFVEQVFLHELLHAFTSPKIRKYEAETNTIKNFTLKEAIPNDTNITLNDKEREAIKSLNILLNQVRSKISNDPTLLAKFQETQEADAELFEEVLYSLDSLEEFITGAFTSPRFQQFLNDIPAPSGKTFWQTLMERVKKLLQAITGLDVKKGSVLEQAMYYTLELVVTEDNETSVPANQEVVTEREFSETKGNYIYRFGVTEDGIVKTGEFRGKNQAEWRPVKSPSKKYNELLTKQEANKAAPISPRLVDKNNQLVLSNGAVISFSEEQVDAIDKIRKWVDTEDNVFSLKGYAGTGKTTIIKKILDEYQKKNPKARIVVSAPTHVASEIIGNTTKKENRTLQSLLGLRAQVELKSYDASDVDFQPVKGRTPNIKRYDLVVIDEASMINAGLLELIESSLDKGSKVIFMGDLAQIPPIGEEVSQVFTKYKKNSAELKETKRLSESNPLGKVHDTIRKNLTASNAGMTVRNTEVNAKGDGIMYTDTATDFLDRLVEAFQSDGYKNDLNYVKAITWTNSSADNMNKSVRRQLYGPDAELVEVNEMLTGARTFAIGSETVIQNSRNYKITSRTYVGDRADGIKGWSVKMQFEKGREGIVTEDRFIVDTKDKATVESFIREHEKIKQDIVNQSVRYPDWTPLNLFRVNNITLESIGSKGAVIYKAMGYGYAGTIHKSQGATYQHVFVNEDNIGQNKNVYERNRILYTAMTRPVHTATVLSSNRAITKHNSHVDKEINITDTLEEGIKNSPFGKSAPLSEQGGSVLDGFLGKEQANINAVPSVIISDSELDAFIKRCKS